MEKTRRGVGGKTSSKVADKHGKFLGFFSPSDDNDGCLNLRPERQRIFEERKLIEIVRLVEKSVKELELFLFLDKHKQSGFYVRVKVEKLFKNIEERSGSGQLRMRGKALGVKMGLDGLRQYETNWEGK
ncbi:hypothetical protein BY996DRAFT_6546289 [Phakopsora pachyrhizi]|nr:hypothetical protein BY996DRAFT_6546289 [Phakopsora pachyrhizi]